MYIFEVGKELFRVRERLSRYHMSREPTLGWVLKEDPDCTDLASRRCDVSVEVHAQGDTGDRFCPGESGKAARKRPTSD